MNNNASATYDETPQPAQQAVASYASYRDAEKAVDYLADNKFPIERVAIVGRELEIVEQVTGKLSALDGIARSALAGAVTGLLIGWLFAVFTWLDPEIAHGWLIIDCIWFGTLVGSSMGLVMYLVTKRRRHFDSVSMMRPEYFDVVVDAHYAEDAARLLRGYPLASRVTANTASTANPDPRPHSPSPAT